MNALQDELNRLRESEDRIHADRSRIARLRAHELQQAGARRLWFEQQCAQLARKIHDAARELHELDRALRLAQRQCKKFEMLKERRQQAWSQLQEKIAQKQIDEIATQGYFRTLSGA